MGVKIEVQLMINDECGFHPLEILEFETLVTDGCDFEMKLKDDNSDRWTTKIPISSNKQRRELYKILGIPSNNWLKMHGLPMRRRF